MKRSESCTPRFWFARFGEVGNNFLDDSQVTHRPCLEKRCPPGEGLCSLCVFCGVEPHWVFAEWIYPGATGLMQSSSLCLSGLALAVLLQRRKWTTQWRSAFTMWSVFEKWGMHSCSRDSLEETAMLTPFLSSSCVFTLPETKVWKSLDFRI